MSDKRLRILHAPLNIASDPSTLVNALNRLGQDADLAIIAHNPLVVDGNIDLSFRGDNKLVRQLRKYQFCKNELPKYDVLHYHFGRSILDYGQGVFSLMDFKQAARRNTPLFVTFHGCEVRNLQPGGCPFDCPERACEMMNTTGRTDYIRRTADLCFVTTPDLLPALPNAQLLPQSVDGIQSAPYLPPNAHGTLKILHAPSAPARKGTEHIVSAVNCLKSEGFDLDLCVLTGVSHGVVLSEMRKCDLFIDQLVTPWYGVASVEAASFGKPVMTAIGSEYVKLSGLAAPPFISTFKERITDDLRALIIDRQVLAEIGKRCRDFVRKRHSSEQNARHLLSIYRQAIDSRQKGCC
ncbi:MAG: hypothetical protein LBS17_01230 [Actinomycetes bacterium]|jgi:hypothetical protein|nr:hypothetical protein [Actinomycetes bacterium]